MYVCRTPLFHAAAFGHEEAVMMLLRAGRKLKLFLTLFPSVVVIIVCTCVWVCMYVCMYRSE